MLCDLIVDPPEDGAWNMGVDEALLLRAAEVGRPTIRFYRWRVPTLSLGYFQSIADRASHPPSRNCTLVRRASGGGALLHDQELTYSLALPGNCELAASLVTLVRLVHQSLLDTLEELCPGARLALCEPGRPRPATEPFLCFQRRSPGDLLAAPTRPQNTARPSTVDGCYKLAGSAQRRHGAAVLQHGGVLLGASPFAPELLGVQELTGNYLPPDSLQEAWQPRLSAALDLELQPIGHTNCGVSDLAEEVARRKFLAPEWTNKR